MKQNINAVLKEVLEVSKPSREDLERIEKYLQNFLEKLNKNIRKNKFNAEVFVGGSYAKKTLMKKEDYDVDIFVRFEKSHKESEISDLLKKCLPDFDKITVIHGSRDYFRLDLSKDIYFEIIPVMKVKSSRDSNNITDLSYFHVKYINKKIKSQKVLDDIILAKKFCHAVKCYGAESYIKGFSGYALELLVYYYGSFVKFIRSIAKHKQGKIIIDIEKLHKNKQCILMDLNSSKLQSPVILIDPTYKQRNALATLSEETFNKFKQSCQKFIKNPNKGAFETKKINFREMNERARKKKFDVVLINAKTNKEKGDIAGSKLLKFYEHLSKEIGEFFDVKKMEFEYQNDKSARYFFAVKRKERIICNGPPVKNEEDVKKFKKKHRNTFKKSGRVYAREKVDFDLKEFLKKWKSKNNKRIREMYLTKLEIIN